MANWYVWRIVLAVSLGTAMAGLHTGAINGIFEMHGFQSVFSENFELSDQCSVDPIEGTLYSEFDNVTAACGICTSVRACDRSGSNAGVVLGLMVSISLVCGIFGTLFGAGTSNAIGRKMVLSISGWTMALGALLSAASFHSWLFIVGRGISGFSYGVAYSALLPYISEMSPPQNRGRLTGITAPTFGVFLVIQYGATCGFTEFCAGWRVSFTLQIAIGVLYGVLMLLVPRSPRWLVLQGRNSEAQVILSRINGRPLNDSTVLEELKELESTTTILSDNYCKNLAQQLHVTVKWKYLQRFLLCCTLLTVAPLIGNFTIYYGTTFLCQLNISGCSGNIIIGICSSVGGSMTTILIDKVGRKGIILVGTFVMLLLQGLMVALIQVFSLEEEGNAVVGYILVVLLCAFAFVYAQAWVTAPWIFCSEVFPVEARGLQVALTSGSFFLSAAVNAQITSLFISSSLGIIGYLYLVIGVTVVAAIIALLAVPETKGVSLERMDELFEKPWLERVDIKFYLSCGISSFFQKNSSGTPEIELTTFHQK